MKRYHLAKENRANGKVFPLREKGSLRDPWNLALLISIASLIVAAVLGEPFVTVIIELITGLIFPANIFMSHHKKVILMCIGWGFMILKAVMNLFLFKFSMWYLMLLTLQLLVTITYFILCYQPQLKKITK